jgi:hypothetical protein
VISVTSQARVLGREAAVVSILASVYFFVAVISTHVLSTQYDVVRDYISDYAIGPWGWIYGSAFWASFIGCFAIAMSLVLLVPAIAVSRIGVVLLVVVGFTYAIDFFFPTDILPPGTPPKTMVGTIHLVAALSGWVLFIVSALLVSSRLRFDVYWKPWHRLLIILAWLSALLLVALVGLVVSKVPFGGLAEKAFILNRNIWALVISILAFNSPDRSACVVKR